MRIRIARILCATLAVAVALAGMSALADVSARFNTTTKAYATWSTSARSVKVNEGLNVTLKAWKNGWAQVGYKGVTAYVPLKYLDLNNPIKAYASVRATVYRQPGSGEMGSITRGTEVYVIGLDGGYYRVQNRSGSVKGYIKGSQLSKNRPAANDSLPNNLLSTTTSRSNKVEYVIYIAQNLVGAAYSSSANPPESFDCAKFAFYCYTQAQTGCMKDTSFAQGYDDRYAIVSYSDLKRGDLGCVDTVSDSDLCDHVGIYLGDGYFIHASSSAKAVVVSRLDSGYYQRTFSWGRRIFP